MATNERKAFQLISGHTPYGFHEYIPGSSTYFTFLRDPVERVVSFYHFVKNSEQHYLNSAAVNEFSGIKPFVNSGITKMVDNGQTRLISGVWLEPGFGDITAQIFDQAKKNLSHNFSIVGLTERFDATLLLLREIFNWQDIYYVRQNVSKVEAWSFHCRPLKMRRSKTSIAGTLPYMITLKNSLSSRSLLSVPIMRTS